MPSPLSAEFERQALDVSTRYSVNLDDVRTAYRHKPESLSAVFNAADESKKGFYSYLGWSIFWAIVFPPVALYTGWKAYDHHRKGAHLAEQVRNDVAKNQPVNG